jgi:hypothetical protein
MRQHRWLAILAGFIVSILGIIIVNWYATLEVRRVKKIIFATNQAIEQLDMDSCITYVAEEYTDHWNFNRNTVYEFGKNLFAQTKSIEITIENLEVLVDDQVAQAEFDLQVKIVLTNVLYSNIELRDVFGTGKQKNKIMVRLVKTPDAQWQINYVGLVETE